MGRNDHTKGKSLTLIDQQFEQILYSPNLRSNT